MICEYDAEITKIVTAVAAARKTARWVCVPRAWNASSGP
jgi:hypothetical protein